MSHFSSARLSEYEVTFHACIRLIFLKNCLSRCAENSEFRLSYKTVVGTIIRLVRLVEKRIGDEIKHTKGCLLFDGCTCGSTHYVACIAFYCAKQFGGNTVLPPLSCIAVSPMARLSTTSCDVKKDVI